LGTLGYRGGSCVDTMKNEIEKWKSTDRNFGVSHEKAAVEQTEKLKPSE
jgi:hypothetical protein